MLTPWRMSLTIRSSLALCLHAMLPDQRTPELGQRVLLAIKVPLCHCQLELLQLLKSALFLEFSPPDVYATPRQQILAGSLRLLDHAQLSTQLQTPSKEHLVLQLSSVVVDSKRLCVLVGLEDCPPLLESRGSKDRRRMRSK